MAPPNQKLKRRQIASYGSDGLLIADLCDRNPDEWEVAKILNLGDCVGLLVGEKPTLYRAIGSAYAIEIEQVPGGFIAYEVEQ